MPEILLNENEELLDFFTLILNFLHRNNIVSLSDPFNYPEKIKKQFKEAKIVEWTFRLNEFTSYCEDDSYYSFTFEKSSKEKEAYVFFFMFSESRDNNDIEISLTSNLEVRFVYLHYCHLRKPLYIIKQFLSEEQIKQKGITDYVDRDEFLDFLEKNKQDISSNIKYIEVE